VSAPVKYYLWNTKLIMHINPKEKKVVQQVQQLLSQNNIHSAKALLIDFTKSNKPGEYTQYYLTLCHAVLGECNEALPSALALVKKDRKNIEYLKLLGCIQHGLQHYNEAISLFERALKINKNDFQTLTNIANSFKETQQTDKAESYYKKSLAIQPSQPDALTNYGLLMQVNAKLDEAIHLHTKALQLSPGHVHALYNLAYALNEKGENDRSLQIYLKVIEAVPQHVRALCDIAHVLGKLKQPEQALPYLQRAIELAPDNEQVFLNLGNTYQMMGELKLAESSFKKVCDINPHNHTAKYYLAIIKGDNTIARSPDDYVQELFDGYAETFDDQLIEKLHYKTPALIGDMVMKYIDSRRKYKILDLGCGTGLAGIYLKDISDYMVGIDLSPKMLKKAEERKIYDELIATGIDPYFASHDFQPDLVISADVFVYIGDISGIFKDVSDSLQDNGMFIFSTEDTDDTEQFLLKESGRFAHNENYIRKLARESSLQVTDNQKTIIRYEADTPIHGQVYLLKKEI